MLHTTSNPSSATLNGKLMNGGSAVMTSATITTGNSVVMANNNNNNHIGGTGSGGAGATVFAATGTAGSAGTLDAATKRAEREHLRAIIAQWNANRLDLFEISEPNEDLEFYGVMRFYFQDAGQKVATKCLRISSSASTHDVIANLIEKFRPDIRMLSVPEYALYEIHENGEERKLAESEMPLLVQLNWHKDDREGRFLLRRMDEKTNLSGISNTESGNLLNRKLSKREKKEKKKREKKEKAAAKGGDKGGKDSLAEKLYTELPETSFTRSISNPEAVMRRRRQQKLEKKLQQFSAEGGPEAGGTLRIFGESINQDVPYKTILLSTRDTAAFAVKEILEKYGKDKEEPANYCLVQIIVPYANGAVQPETNGTSTSSIKSTIDNSQAAGPVREYILDDDDCPLIIERSHLKTRGVLTFHIRRRPPDYQPRKRKKKSPGSAASVSGGPQSFDGNSSVISDLGSIKPQPQLQQQEETATSALLNGGAKLMPYIVEVNADGSELTLGRSSNIPGTTGPRRHFLFMNVTEVGAADAAMLAGSGSNLGRAPSTNSNSNRSSNSIQLLGPNILPRHCIITHSEGLITVTPCSREAETFVNGTRITETTVLKHGMLVRFGKLHTFKFVDEGDALRRQLSTSTGTIIGQHFAQQQAAAAAAASTGSNSNLPMTNNASYETTFDVEGKVETSGNSSVHPSFSSGSLQRTHLQQQQQHQFIQPFSTGSLPRSASANSGGGVFHNNHHHHPQSSFDAQQQLMPPPTTPMMRGAPGAGQTGSTLRKQGGGDNILPAILEVWEEIEPLFLNLLITRADPNAIQFKLAITYTLYMVTRFRASTYFKPEIVPNQRATLLIGFCIRYSKLIQEAIRDHLADQAHLAFWLANSSELLHFLKNDRHLSAFTLDSQDYLGEAVQLAFAGLVRCQQAELSEALSAFPDDEEIKSSKSGGSSGGGTSTARVLVVLSNSMSLLRRFRVNAALTIQLFSQLFHYINMWLFNRVLGSPESNLCSRPQGDRLKAALLEIEAWAEKQGLELAAECHLSRIAQTAQFLQAPKAGKSTEELTSLVANFYKLNSLQLRALFERYQPTSEEVGHCSRLRDPATIETVVKMARVATDELILKEGREVRLEEELDLQLPFLLPEDGYSCDIVVGIPATLADFVQSLVAARVAKLTVQPTASGYWTIYFINFMPEVVTAQAQAHHHQTMNSQETSTQSSSGTAITTSTSGHFSGGGEQLSSGSGSVASKSSTLVAAPISGTGPGGHPHPLATSQLMLNGQPFRPAPGMSPLPSPQRSVSGMVMGGSMSMPPPQQPVFNHFNGMRTMPEPEVQTIKLQKINNGIGLSIVAAQGTHQPVQGIYIKSVVKDGAADLDGRLKAGDQLLKVDGHSLIGIDQESAAKLMTNTGPVVTLEVAKQGAVFHGLSGLLKEQSASTSSLLKQATMRPRFANVPNDQYGAIRAMSQQNLMGGGHPRMGMTLPNGPGNFNPAYNTLPMGANLYSQQFQQGGMARSGPQLAHNSSSHSSLLLQHHHQQQLQQQQQQQLPMRSDSQLSFTKPIYEERHYQNIQLYQLNPRTGSPIAGGSAAGAPGMQPQMARIPQMPIHHGSHSSLQPHDPTSSSQLTSMGRPVSALVTSREQEQMPLFAQQQQQNYGQLQSPVNRSATANLDARQRDLMRQEAKMEEIREELRRREDRGGSGGSSNIPRQVLGASSSSSTSSMIRQNPSASGTLLRTSGLQQQQQQQQQQYPLVSSGNRLNSGGGGGPPPAPAPKPTRPASGAFNSGNLQQPGSSTMASSSQQPMATQISYRYGPSGYPPQTLANSNNNTTKSMQSSGTSGRATASSSAVTGKSSPSPWEREEKEKEQALKSEDNRERSREEEIRHLESLPYRNPKNEERLRALILERDFQRRAAEHAVEDEEEEDYEEAESRMLDRADQRERMMNLQADIERTRQRRLEGRYGDGYDQGSDGKLNKTLEEQEERLKMLRLEEEAAQQAEERLLQEAAKRRKEDDSVNRAGGQQSAPLPLISKGILKSSNTGNSSNFNNNLDNDLPPPLPNSPPPLESANQRLDRLLLSTAHPKTLSEDSTPLTMVAPRGGVLKNGTAYNGAASGNSDQSSSSQPKKVSWNTKTTVVVTPEDAEDDNEDEDEEEDSGNRQNRKLENNNDNGGDDEDEEYYAGNNKGSSNGGSDDLEETFSLQDIEDALVIGGDINNTANTSSGEVSTGDLLTANSYDEEWHTKYVSSGHTSGVIGTQEIYNDPRQRIEAARRLAATNANQSALTGDKVPEKLSFAEKMKMFAKTSGAAAEDENNQISSARGVGNGGGGGGGVSGKANSTKNLSSTSSLSRSTTVNGER